LPSKPEVALSVAERALPPALLQERLPVELRA
jgi:hypothetical protein